MKSNKMQSTVVSALTLALALLMSVVPAFAQEGEAGSVVDTSIEATRIVWQPLVEYGGAVLTYAQGGNEVERTEFGAESTPELSIAGDSGNPLADGLYNYELMILRPSMAVPPADFEEEKRGIVAWEGTVESMVHSGTFAVQEGSFVTQDELEKEKVELEVGEAESDTEPGAGLDAAIQDQVFNDDLIVDGSMCVGFDCVSGESFGFDTIKLKENNLRIKFQDTSVAASFPTRDWQITINDSTNGGQNKFSIDDIDGGRTPFTIEGNAPSHSLYVDDGGRLGLGTSTPVVDAHIVTGNTPTMRLEQDGSSGFTPQTWDVAGNEANFFIRDATNGSNLPFRIRPGAPSGSIDIRSDGDVEFAESIVIGERTSSGAFEIGVGGRNAKMVFSRIGGATAKVSATQSKLVFGTETNHRIEFRVNDAEALSLATNGDLNLTNGDMNANAFNPTSDVNAKENFATVDGQEVLIGLAELPITTWNFKSDEATTRHMGPTAQDFSAAFGLGKDDKHISTVDSDGVALVAIQELYAQHLALQEENAALSSKVDNLEARLAALEASDGAEPTVSFWQKTGFVPSASVGLLALGLVGLVWVSRRND